MDFASGAIVTKRTCTHIAGRRYLFASELYQVAVQSIEVNAEAQCGGAFTLEIVTTYASGDELGTVKTSKVRSNALASGTSARLLVVSVQTTLIEVVVDRVEYDSAKGEASAFLQLLERDLQDGPVLSEVARFRFDLSKLECKGEGNGMGDAPPAPTRKPQARTIEPCVNDLARCHVMCAPFQTQKCSCSDNGELVAFCAEVISASSVASCHKDDEIGRRCKALCPRSDFNACKCNTDGGFSANCLAHRCPATLQDDCETACKDAGVQVCLCDQNEPKIFCGGQAVPAAYASDNVALAPIAAASSIALGAASTALAVFVATA